MTGLEAKAQPQARSPPTCPSPDRAWGIGFDAAQKICAGPWCLRGRCTCFNRVGLHSRPAGAFVRVAGETVELEFPIPHVQHVIRTRATVTWQNSEEPQDVDALPAGCGLRFDGLPLEDGLHIANLVKEYRQEAPAGAALPRIPYVQRCQLISNGRTRSGMLCNLSVLGVYLTVDPIPESGEHVFVSFLFPGDALAFEGHATVTWQNLEQPDSLDGLPRPGRASSGIPSRPTRERGTRLPPGSRP